MAARAGKPPGAERVLVIQTAFLGDIVLATSFLANLRALLPSAEIVFLTTPVGALALEPNELGLRVLPYDKRGRESGLGGFLRKARELRDFRPDLVFCLHRSLRSALLTKVSGGRSYGFHDAAGSVLFDHRVRRPKAKFEAEKNHELLLDWAGEVARGLPLFPRLSFSQKEEEEARQALAGLSDFVALAPSSVWATKRWPAERFGALAFQIWRQTGLRSVILGGEEAKDLALGVDKGFRSLAPAEAPPPLDLSGKTSLGSLKAVLSQAKLVVANDSAPLHVAIACGTPVVGVFGPTTRELGFFPLAPEGKSAVAEVQGLECRPCGLHGHQRCPRSHFRCMLDLSVDSVWKEVEAILCRR